MVRHSLKYVPHKEKKEVAKDLKSIYSAINEKHAKENLEEFKKRWNNKLNSSTKCNKSYNF